MRTRWLILASVGLVLPACSGLLGYDDVEIKPVASTPLHDAAPQDGPAAEAAGDGASAGGSAHDASAGSAGIAGSAGGGAGGVAGAGGAGGGAGSGGSAGTASDGGSGGAGGTAGSAAGGASGAGGSVVFGDPFRALSADQGSFDAAQAQTLRALGAGMVRLQFCNWQDAAAKTYLDGQVNTALAAGLRVYAELNYCTLPAPDDPAERQKYWHKDFSDAGNAFAWSFASAAGEIADAFQGRIYAYEIWNEPDAAPRPLNWPTAFWSSSSNADWDGACGTYDYGVDYNQGAWALCPRQLGVITTNAYMAIKQKDAAARVVAGNVLFHGDTNGVPDGWVAKEYWKQVAQCGAVQWFKTMPNKPSSYTLFPWDHVGIHPYSFAPVAGKLDAQLDSVQAILTGYADTSSIVLSEYGWTTGAGDPNSKTDEPTQAIYVKDTFTVADSRNLGFVVWFNYLDATSAGLNFGLRRDDMSWKPSAKAFCQSAGAIACPAP